MASGLGLPEILVWREGSASRRLMVEGVMVNRVDMRGHGPDTETSRALRGYWSVLHRSIAMWLGTSTVSFNTSRWIECSARLWVSHECYPNTPSSGPVKVAGRALDPNSSAGRTSLATKMSVFCDDGMGPLLRQVGWSIRDHTPSTASISQRNQITKPEMTIMPRSKCANRSRPQHKGDRQRRSQPAAAPILQPRRTEAPLAGRGLFPTCYFSGMYAHGVYCYAKSPSSAIWQEQRPARAAAKRCPYPPA
ncbi:hypothetical protein BJY00DRAFT_72349 [Aspergillus carlsbadensis]|nr:hypothetical protein BJY00DRAFT_72349 [Aspergillus carlsbadensis]